MQIQIWDLNSGKIVWDGFVQGQDLVKSEGDLEGVINKLARLNCQLMTDKLGSVNAVSVRVD